MVEGGMTCVKYLLFGFNLIFFLVGLGLITCGAVIQAHFREYFDIIGTSFNAASALLIVVGCVILIIAFFGCCGAVKENYCMVMTFAVLLGVILILEVAAAITAFKMQEKVEDVVEKGLRESLDKYSNKTAAGAAWDALQKKLKCCGVDDGPKDWNGKVTGLEYPKSCCRPDKIKDKECGKAAGMAWQQGCVPKLRGVIENEIMWIGITGLAMAVIEIVGIIFACCLGRSIKQGYQSV